MLRNQWLTAALTVVAAYITQYGAIAAGCDHCNRDCGCRKVCRLVCEEKKVEITCWGIECEDFCLPKHGKPGCKHCELVCDEDCGEELRLALMVSRLSQDLHEEEADEESRDKESSDVQMGRGGPLRRMRVQAKAD
jgi:hypothetical protein